MSLEDRIADELLYQILDVHRFEAGLELMVSQMLSKLLREMILELMQSGIDAKRTDWQRARFQHLLKDVSQNIRGTFANIDSALGEQIAGMVEVVSDGTVKVLRDLTGLDVQPVKWSPERLQSLAGNSMIDGAPSAEWWSRQGDYLTQKFTDQMRSGMLRGESIPQLVRRIEEHSELAGIVGRNAQTLVRTSALAAANAANLETFRANSDLIGSVQWVATLDPKTCLTCGQLDGKKWPNEAGHPVPPRHFGCRCLLVSVTKSFEQLAREAGGDWRAARELDRMQAEGEMRASETGPVSSRMTYEEWLKGQPVARQQEILGRDKFEVWSRQKLSLTDLLDQRGNPLTLEELRKKWG